MPRRRKAFFHEPDERYWVGAGFTRSERYLVIDVGSSITTEEYLVPASDLRQEPRSIWPRREGVEYSATHAVVDGDDVLYIVHNDGALDFELVRSRPMIRPACAPSSPRTSRDATAGCLGLPRLGGRRIEARPRAPRHPVVRHRRDPRARLRRRALRRRRGRNPEWRPWSCGRRLRLVPHPGYVHDYVVEIKSSAAQASAGAGRVLPRRRSGASK
ncbi:MAG: hypothetical protein R2692_03555 [Microbacterium sp.]